MASAKLVLGLPAQVFYLFAVLGVIIFLFVVYRRPLYECMAIGYICIVGMTGRYDLFWQGILSASTSTIVYAICIFIIFAQVFNETGTVQKINDIILSVVGRFRGGAAWISLIGSTFEASLSGSAPGNVVSSGSFTIPAMIRSGFPRTLAACVEMGSSNLGPIIPPSTTLILCIGVMQELYPNKYPASVFWVGFWGVGVWFIVQLALTIYGFIRYYNVRPMPPEDIPSFGNSLRLGWQVLLLPFIVFIPFMIDAWFPSLLSRVSPAARTSFSGLTLVFIPSVAILYSLLIGRKNLQGGLSPMSLFKLFQGAMRQVCPIAIVVLFSLAIGFIFARVGIGDAAKAYIVGFGLSKFQMVIAVSLTFVVFGTVLSGTAMVATLGVAAVGALTSAGIDPLLAGLVLPAMVAISGMVPPMAATMLAAIGIAKSDFLETAKLTLVWAFLHWVVIVLLLMGALPVFGM